MSEGDVAFWERKLSDSDGVLVGDFLIALVFLQNELEHVGAPRAVGENFVRAVVERHFAFVRGVRPDASAS